MALSERHGVTNTQTVRVRCDRCGPRLVALSAVRLLERGELAEYAFTCAECGTRHRRTADVELRAVLRAAGASQLTLLADSAPNGAPNSESAT